MHFRRLLIRRRRIIIFYLLICFIFCTISVVFVVLVQPNRLIRDYYAAAGAGGGGGSYYLGKNKRNVNFYAGESRHGIDKSFEERYAQSLAKQQQDIHVVIGYYQGNNFPWIHNENLTEELLNTNMYSPDPAAGANGEPVFIQSFESSKKAKLFQINRFNLMASDRIPLNRTLPDVRRKQCRGKPYYQLAHIKAHLQTTSIIIVFHNEAWSTLLRTVHSVISRSRVELLSEIILVDDASQREFLRRPLDDYVAKLPIPVQVLRSKVRIGLIKARLLGAEIAKGQVLTFLDAHCEVTEGWLEPLLARIHENGKSIVSPVIDIINDESFQYVRSFELHQGAFNWELHFRWFSLPSDIISQRQNDPTQPFETPVMAGGLFSIDKAFFYELGSYDDMKIWGGENLEISFRGWMCGAILEILPCSHVGHLFRKSSPYTFPGGVGDILNSNLARVSLVWMDEWKDFYFALHPEVAAHAKNQTNLNSRLSLRSTLKCKSFSWYLSTIWPTHFFPAHDRFVGKIRNSSTRKCLQVPSKAKASPYVQQPYGIATTSDCIYEIYGPQLFIHTPDGYLKSDDSVCLDSPEYKEEAEDLVKNNVRIMACNNLKRQKWSWENSTSRIVHQLSGKCLDLAPLTAAGAVSASASAGSLSNVLQLRGCVEGKRSQQWSMEPVKWTTTTTRDIL